MTKISACIVTWNEEKNIERCIRSVSPHVDEIVLVDMSTDKADKTTKIARALGAKTFLHPYTGFVEPARNFSFQKSTGDWIFIIDADEEIPPSLGTQLKTLSTENFNYYEIPRKNLIFNKFIQHTRFWPDYQTRFFQKGVLSWPNTIHSQPHLSGIGKKLDPNISNAIIHHHYSTVSEYIKRVDRYTNHQKEILLKNGYKFTWRDFIKKPTGEFLSRFYQGNGYKDGLHGLALSLLQAFSELVLYLKIWESEGFVSKETEDFKRKSEAEIKTSIKSWRHWIGETGGLLEKIKSRLV